MGCNTTRIPANVESLYESCMFNLISIRNLEIPASVKSIGPLAFADCFYIESVVAKGTTPPTLGANALRNLHGNCVLTVPEGTKDAYIAAGWTTDIFKGGIVEAPEYDANGDGQTTIVDVTRLVDKIIGK